MPDITFESSTGELADAVHPLAEKLRGEGFDVDELQELREDALPQVLWILGAIIVEREIYPRVRKELVEWITEQPRRKIRVRVRDREDVPVDDFILGDDEAS